MTRTESFRIDVGGMSCQHCVARVKLALEKLAGLRVESVTIGEAVVAIDDERVGRDEILAAIRSAGYSAQ